MVWVFCFGPIVEGGLEPLICSIIANQLIVVCVVFMIMAPASWLAK